MHGWEVKQLKFISLSKILYCLKSINFFIHLEWITLSLEGNFDTKWPFFQISPKKIKLLPSLKVILYLLFLRVFLCQNNSWYKMWFLQVTYKWLDLLPYKARKISSGQRWSLSLKCTQWHLSIICSDALKKVLHMPVTRLYIMIVILYFSGP